MGNLLDGIKAIAQEHGHNFASIEDVEAWCREQRANPAPAPLPSFAFDSHTHALKFIAASLTDLGGEQEALDTVCAHISDLTRRLAEAEAERDGTVQLLGCHPAFVSDEIGRLQEIVSRTPNADEHRQLQSRVVELAADWQVQFARAEAAEAKSARLGSAKEKLAKRLHDTRVKLAKVECEATVHYEDMRRMRKRLEALEKALRWAAPFLPKDGTIDVTVQSALSATEVEHA